MAGAEKEKQEFAFLDAVLSGVEEHGKITLLAGLRAIPDIIGAEKVRERTSFGYENYTDIIIHQPNNKLRFQLKDNRPKTFGGGGDSGIEASLPGFGDMFIKKGFSYFVKQHKAKEGDTIPTKFYMRLTPQQQLVLLRGTPAIGGPIDYVFVGPKELKWKYHRNNLIFTSSAMLTVEEYSPLKTFFISYESLKGNTFAPKLYGKRMVPKIYGPKGGRLYMKDSVPKDGVLLI
jgi:hypothetical protein